MFLVGGSGTKLLRLDSLALSNAALAGLPST
jgi:hypothetical protein